MKTIIKIVGGFVIVLFFSEKGNGQNGTITDKRDGKSYKTVQIGSQTWMAEDLALKSIDFTPGFSKSDTIVFDFGILYSWQIAQVVCPTGSHLPSKEEFELLLTQIGGTRREQYHILIEGAFNALNGSSPRGAMFWTSTASKYAAVRAIFPPFGGGVFLNKVGKKNYGAVRCLMNSK